MSRPSLLFLAQVLPHPLDAGPKVRAYHTLRCLADWADVTLVCFVRTDDPTDSLHHLRSFCVDLVPVPMRRSILANLWYMALALVTGRSFILLRDERRAMRRALAVLQSRQRFDVLHVDQLWMASYARHVEANFTLLDDHNAVYLVFERLAAGEPRASRRWLLRREARYLARYEAAQLECFDRILFVSEEDRLAMHRVANAKQQQRLADHSTVLPICIDTNSVEPVETLPDARRITILGTMFWPPNAEGAVWYAECVLPQVLEAVPEARLTIIGKRPSAKLKALAERYGPAMEVLGYVSELRPYLEQTAIFVVPLLSGGGMRVKILNAWAWALPVLSTTVGAEGIDLEAGEEAILADDPHRFAHETIRLLRDPAARRAIGRAGRAAVESRYDIGACYNALETVYAPILESHVEQIS